MRRINTYKMKGKTGFTLVEMIVVLVMLAILAAIAVPAYTGYVDSNKEKQCDVERKAIAAHLEEMQSAQVTGTAANADAALEAYITSQECPAGGGHYSMTSNGESVTIKCSVEAHGETTVLVKGANIVTAKASTQTEAPNNSWTPAPETPVFTISVTSQSPNMYIDAQQTISANFIKTEGCTTPYSFTWSCDPNIAEIIGDSTGQTIEIRAKSAGSCKISCTATATTENGQISDSADVTVNIEYVVPHLSFSIAPKSLEMEVGADSKTLTVDWRDDYYCRVDRFDWWAEPADSVSLSINEDGTVATVTALKATSAEIPCVIHCKAEATADAKAGGQKLDPVIVDVPVTVKSESKKQKLLKNIPDPLLINGNDNGINMSQYVETEGGVWTTNSSNIVCSEEMNNHWIQAKAAGECEYTYTLKGESESVEARVVYPIRGFYSTTNTTNILTMKIGESNWEFPANPDPGNTTDVSANWVWGHSGEDGIISYSLNPEKTKATVTALSEGYVELEVSARSEYETWKNGSDVWKTLKWKINVIDPNKLTGISVNNIGMKVNDVRQIQVNCNPSGVNREGISFDYSGYGDCISIDANGNIKAMKKGSTMVTVQARKNGEDLEGISCTFNVAVTDLQSIAVEPQNVNVKSGETTTAKIVYKPEGADISQVNFVPEGFDPNKFVISQNEKGKLEIQGKQACNNVGVYVKASVYGDEVAASNFQVSVTSDSNSTTEPTAIELVLRNGLPDVMQGKKITVTKYPDETGDIVVCPVPRTASLDNYTLSSWPDNYNLIGGDGVASKDNTGETGYNVQAVRYNPEVKFIEKIILNVREDPNGPIKYYVNGSQVSSTPWSVLKDYIKRKSEDPNVQPSSTFGIFAASSSELYVLKENPQLMWQESYEGVTFGEYLNLDNNIDQFVKVDTSQITWAGNQFSGGIGSILGRNGVYYVCVRTVPDNEKSNTNNDNFINEYFVRLS